ncbi:DUF2993 domain-containing protein [Geitlerinema splendidum]|nr:DUF2993 domain-containing protein [Geitlerinema splendidum]
MEFLTILLSGLLLLASPIGLVVDRVGERLIRSQFERIEQLEVRVDNPPSHQLLQGKVERIQIAGRGLWLQPDIRLAAVDIETDPIDLDLPQLRERLRQRDFSFLERPIQAGIRLALSEEDINRALRSPAVTNRLRTAASQLLPGPMGAQVNRYEILAPQVEFLGNNRFRIQVNLQEQGTTTTPITLTAETGLGTIGGRKLQLLNPRLELNGTPVPELFVNLLTEGVNRRLDLQVLEASGITARLLQVEVNPEQMEMAAFVRLAPPSR